MRCFCVSSDERHKLEPKARRGILVGHGSATKGYRLFDRKSQNVFIRKDVIFNELENEKWQSDRANRIEGNYFELNEKQNEETNQEENFNEETTNEENEIHNDLNEIEDEEPIQLRRSTRVSRKPDYLINSANIVETSNPNTLKEALDSKEKWKAAMDVK